MQLAEWIDSVSGTEWVWYAKRLSANDTGATGSHQVGLYLPRFVTKAIAGDLLKSKAPNPSQAIDAIPDHRSSESKQARIIWYNSRVLGTGTRNEIRITGWGGRSAPVQNPEATGALAVIAFRLNRGTASQCRVWVCENPREEDELEAITGCVEPGQCRLHSPGRTCEEEQERGDGLCDLSAAQLPPAWKREFPSAQEIVAFVIDRVGDSSAVDPDGCILTRRKHEYQLFKSIESFHVLPRLSKGFSSVDDFIAVANAVTNRRRARSGRSLELHLKAIFTEKRVAFEHNVESEKGHRPDFIFPSQAQYRNARVPADQLTVLAVKATCKDRWRQILHEADRLNGRIRHLFTLQEGVSVQQFEEMRTANVQLVIPEANRQRFPPVARSQVISLRDFIAPLPRRSDRGT